MNATQRSESKSPYFSVLDHSRSQQPHYTTTPANSNSGSNSQVKKTVTFSNMENNDDDNGYGVYNTQASRDENNLSTQQKQRKQQLQSRRQENTGFDNDFEPIEHNDQQRFKSSATQSFLEVRTMLAMFHS